MEQSYNKEPLKSFNVGLFIGVLLGGDFIAGMACLIPVAGFVIGPVLGLCVFIFLLVMLNQIPKGLNLICHGDDEHTMNWICAWLLSGITACIFGVVYCYGMQKRMSVNSKKYDAEIGDSSPSTMLVLMLCGYMTVITWIIGLGMIISSYNRLVYAYNNSIDELPCPEPLLPSPDPTVPQRQGKLRCLHGELAGASIILDDNKDIIIGRQADKSNLVISSSKVSRAHCSISYDCMTDQFYITDFSSNGTKLMNGSNLLSNVKTPVANNTEFELPDKSRFIVTSGPVIPN